MPIIKGGGSEIFIDRVDVEFVKGVDRGDCVLPDITNDIVELSCFEHVDRVGAHPVFHVDVAN